MILIKPSAKIGHAPDGDSMLDRLEVAGRVCYKSEDKIGPGTAKKLITSIIGRGHEAVIEHESVTARFIVDRGVSHEIVRHRIASYCQESTRYCNYGSGHVVFILPPWCQIAEGTYGKLTEVSASNRADFTWANAMLKAEMIYQSLRDMKWSPQMARTVLPNSLKTELVMTANLREWRHFFKLRCAQAAHPQMREVAIPLLMEFQKVVPVVFDDL
jgi:thymidylate synthase (FAD)